MAKTKVYKIYGSAAASTNSLASIIIQRDGYIHGLHASLSAISEVNGHYFNAELSFSSVSQSTTNDTIGPIFGLELRIVNASNGNFVNNRLASISGLAIPVKAGDRLYLNTAQSASTCYCTFYVYVAE